MAYTTDDALRIARAFLEQAAKRHAIVRAYLFGSFACGRQKDYSDIDLAIVLGGASASTEQYLDEAFEIFHEAQEYDSRLEVLCFRQDEFEANGASVVGRIREEGLAVEVG